jgi:threonine dehydratase
MLFGRWLRILEQVERIDAVIIPVGGGGLIAGIALALKTLNPQIQIIVSAAYAFCHHTGHSSSCVKGVESDTCPSFHKAVNQSDEEMHPELTLADGLAVPVSLYAYDSDGEDPGAVDLDRRCECGPYCSWPHR